MTFLKVLLQQPKDNFSLDCSCLSQLNHSELAFRIFSFMPEISRDLLIDLDPDKIFLDSLSNDDLKPSSIYYSIRDFNQLDLIRNLTLSIVHLNVRSFGANSDKCQGLFASCNLVPVMLILSETLFIHENPRDLNGYSGYQVT